MYAEPDPRILIPDGLLRVFALLGYESSVSGPRLSLVIGLVV